MRADRADQLYCLWFNQTRAKTHRYAALESILGREIGIDSIKHINYIYSTVTSSL